MDSRCLFSFVFQAHFVHLRNGHSLFPVCQSDSSGGWTTTVYGHNIAGVSEFPCSALGMPILFLETILPFTFP